MRLWNSFSKGSFQLPARKDLVLLAQQIVEVGDEGIVVYLMVLSGRGEEDMMGLVGHY